MIFKASRQPSDFEAWSDVKMETNMAPNMEYPTKDIRGREIGKFDKLVVMTDCKSCSQFRTRIRPYMESQPNKKWLIASPDLVGLDDILKRDNYYFVTFDSKSKFSYIPAGVYSR